MCCTPTGFFKCLADETRLNIVLLLAQHDSLCVCNLHETLDAPQPKISRHLAELRKYEIVVTEKRGKWVHYQINPNLPEWAQRIVNDMVTEFPAYSLKIPLKFLVGC